MGKPVGERNRQRHQLLGLRGRVAEHHSLVAGAGDIVGVARTLFAVLGGVVDALSDVHGLLVHLHEHLGGVGAELRIEAVVADLADRLAGNALEVDLGVGADLTRDHDEVRVDEGFAGDARFDGVGIGCQDGVEYAVGDLVGDLVGVPLGDGFGREEMVI